MMELKTGENKDWDKEIKKGAEIIVSKKQLAEEENPKKGKKDKKKKEKAEEVTTGITHHIDISDRFGILHLLPPTTQSEIDDVIAQIKEKKELYEKPTEEEIENFKREAEKEFNRLHGFHSENDRKPQYKEKNHEKKV